MASTTPPPHDPHAAASQSATQRLCSRIAGIGYDDLGEEALDRARQLFLDGIAVAVAGTAKEKPPSLLAAHVKYLGGEAQASVIGFGFKTSLTQAAYVNGASMHVLDFEPMWMPSNHQLSTCLPAILALAEQRSLPGREVAAALLKGTEMMGRLRHASNQLDLRAPQFHLPGFIGPMGAAVAAGHMLGLDADRMRHALAIAGSRCAALWPNNGTDTKSTHCGAASATGLEAALLAERGFTGNPDILEASRGYVATYFDASIFDWEQLHAFGTPWRAVDPGYAIKMYPSQFTTHYIITAVLELRDKVGDPGQLESMVLHAPDVDYVNRPRPHSGLAGKFSYQYTAACAWLDGTVTMDSFTDERRFRPDMEAMLERITLAKRPDIPATPSGRYVEAEAKLRNGETVKTVCDGPPGGFGKPPIPTERHMEKVRACLATRLSQSDAEMVVDYGRRLERLDGAEVQALMAVIGRG